MNYEITDCIDAGTEFCPCHLAEADECILCSQLSGKTLCDCINWKGVCIFQEYIWNGNKPKRERDNYLCKILDVQNIGEKLIIFTILVAHKQAQNLIHPGSYVFIREKDSINFYDTPISVMQVNLDENYIKIAIELKGIKTKKLENLKIDDSIIIRGPFWNGIQGLKNIYSAKDGTSVVIVRGVGMAPSVPVIKKLFSNGNKIIAFVDKARLNDIFIKDELMNYNCETVELNILSEGNLAVEFKSILAQTIEKEKTNLIFCAGPDILTSRVIEEFKTGIKLACCNNAKMCCGEGICGSCTSRFDGDVIKRLCKIQVSPDKLFNGSGAK